MLAHQGTSDYSVTETLEGQWFPDNDPKLQPYKTWDGDKCRSIVSTEGIVLVAHLPDAVKGPALVSI